MTKPNPPKRRGWRKVLFKHTNGHFNDDADWLQKGVIAAMTEYASIVSAAKDQRIAELEKEFVFAKLELAEARKENERLRGLVEKAFNAGFDSGRNADAQEVWQQFKEENKI